MQQIKLVLVVVLFVCIGQIGVQAQDAIPASGGNTSGSGGTVSYTVGQAFYTTNLGTNGSVTEGVQQAIEIEVIEGIEHAKGINLICKAYPNPTTDFLILNIENYDNRNLSYQLFDISGKLIENKKLMGKETTIMMTKFVPAIYFLKVTDNKKEIKIFQIIKK